LTRGGDQRRAACLTDEERDPRICTDERLLQRNGVGCVPGHEDGNVVEDHLESCLRPFTGRRSPASRRQTPDTPVALLDHGIAARRRPRVDAEHYHE